MKINEAPEKIYIDSKAIGDDISTTVHTKRQDYPTCTEYIRTDAFVKKALGFIKANVDRIVNNQHGVCMGCMDDEFKNYMKG